MNNLLRCLVLFLFITAGVQQKALASHAMGADISYVNVGQDSFIITFNFYRDCNGISAPTTATISYSSVLCGYTNSIDLPLTATIQPQNIPNGSEVSALCGNSIGNSTCNGGTLPGVQQYQYSALVVLPFRCTDWLFSYDICCRNSLITNLQNPGGDDLYVEAHLNSTIFPQDNSPVFTNRPVPYFCYLDSIQYNHGSIDVDGDSLVYSLINPLGAGGTPIPYNTPYSPTNPLSTNGPFGFDPTSGQMTFVPSALPTQAQTAVIAILVQEYRNGVFIGSTIRDIQVNILGNPICIPPYGQIRTNGIDSSSVTGGADLGNYTLQVCPGSTLTFNISFGGDSVYLSSNASLALPGATFNVSTVHSTGGITDSVLGHFSWTPTALDTGTKVFSLQYGVSACPIDRTSSRTVTIEVLKGTSAGPDKRYCTTGQPVQLYAVGGTQFTWSPTAGLSDPNIRNPLASPTVTTDYVVTSNLQGQCHNQDTVEVRVVPNFIESISPQNGNLNLCRNALVALSVLADSTYGPYTYHWTPAAGLVDSAGNVDSTTAGLFARPAANTTYTVYVTSDSGCTIKDSVSIHLTNQGPKVVINADKHQTCAGDTVHLNSAVYPVSCGASVGSGSCGVGHPPVPVVFGTGTATSAIAPFGGSNPVYRYQVLYRQADLIAAGVNAGTIVRLRFNVNAKSSTGVYNHFTIKLGCSSSSQLSNNNWETVSTQVYYANTQLINNGLNTFTLNQPYDWDGYSSLVMEICFGDTSASAGGDDNVLSTPVNYPASMSASSATSTGGCVLPASLIPTSQPPTTNASVPNVTFYFCAASNPTYTYSWSPSGGLSSTTAPSTVATVTQPVTYVLTVTDSLCSGNDLIRLFPDSTSLFMPHDTALCSLAPGDSLHFHLTVGGTPFAQCGSNGNTCSGPLVDTKVGNGTNTNTDFTYPSAFGNYYGSSMQQFLYSAADLTAAGVTPGRVKELAFYITDLAGTLSPYPNYMISEKCTNVNSLTIGTPESGLTTVFNPKSVVPVVGINNFTLDNAFDWDGTSNIVIQICFDNSSAPFPPYSSNAYTSYSNTGYLSSTYYNDDNSNQCTPSSLPLVTGGNFYRPNTRFSVCPASPPATVVWHPGNTLSDSTSFNPVAFPNTTTTYKATVTTLLGCTKTDSVTVRIGTLNHTISHDTTVCTGGNAYLAVVGGNQYSWSPAAGLSCTNCPNPVASPTSTTRYHVTISDTTIGCNILDSVKVTVIAGPTPPFGNDTSICFTDSVILHAGPGFTTYQWSVPNGNDSNLVVRSAGTYSVTITAATGCVVSDTITINQRAAPPVNLGNDTTLCQGNSLTLDAGQAYTKYHWSTSDSLETINVLTTNYYSVTVTDVNGCHSSDSIHVTFNAPPLVNLGNDTLLCHADTLRLNAYNGPSYTYLWSTGETNGIISVTAQTQQPVSVTVSGGGAVCTLSDTINVTFRAPVQVFIGNDTAICLGQSVTFDAGAGFSSYLWNTTPPTTTQTATVSTGGPVEVTVTDNIGCRGIDTAILTVNSTPVTIVPSSVNGLCVGDSLVLTANIAQPAGATYIWSTGDTTQSITVTTTSNYCVTVTPTTGCPGSACDTVTFVPKPLVNIGPDQTLCPGIPAIFDAGPQPTGFTYHWSDGSTNESLIVNVGGIVWVDVTNPTGCTIRDSAVVTYRQVAPLNAGNDTTVCAGSPVTFTASAGFIGYAWSTTATTQSITVTVPGKYKVTATDNNGCTVVDSVILANTNAAINLGPDQNLCHGSSLTLDAGQGYNAYHWSTGPTTETLNVNSAGAYSVTATDASGCTATDTIVIGLNPAVTPNLGNDTTLCPGTPYTLYPGAYASYNWSDGSHNSTLTIGSSGTYFVSVKDTNGCTGSDTAVISFYPAPTPLTPDNQALCRNAVDTLHGPAGYVRYIWSNGDTTRNALVNTPGNYSLTVIDGHGCPVTVVDSVVSGIFPVRAGVDPSPINAGQTATLSPQTNIGGHYIYAWTPSTSLNDSTLVNPTASPTVTTTYTVLVTDTITHCFDTSSITLTVFNQALFVFPEAFTPNGDGHNDFFGMIGSGSNVVLKEFRIYNRFGALVHSAPIPWNGEVAGSPQPADSYVYTAQIEITDATGVHTYNYNGAFTLIR